MPAGFDPPAGLPCPEPLRSYIAARRAWCDIARDADRCGGPEWERFLRAQRALETALKMRGGTWEHGGLRYSLEVGRGIAIEQTTRAPDGADRRPVPAP